MRLCQRASRHEVWLSYGAPPPTHALLRSPSAPTSHDQKLSPNRNCKNPEAEAVVAVVWVVPEPVRRLAEVPVAEPTAATVHTVRAFSGNSPFPYITMHIIHSQSVGEVVSYNAGGFNKWAFFARTRWIITVEIGLCGRQIVAANCR